MYLVRFFHFILSAVSLSLFVFFVTSHAHAQVPSELIRLSNEVQQLIKVNDEKINADTVMNLTKKILSDRQHYSNDILAKVFLLSANVASNQGDINKVFHFAKQGLAVNSRDKKIQLSLLLKLAEVHVAKKEYELLLQLTQNTVNNSENSHSDKHYLLSLSYRSVAFAMLGQHQQALVDLQKVELGISKSELTEHIELLTILSLAYYRLADYQTSLTMQLKILKLRFEMKQVANIDQTYLYLGNAYFYLLRFDDAYNAFWESKKYAERKKAPISVAHAQKWLGLVLLKQHDFSAAIQPLEQAVLVFEHAGITSEYIESLTALAKAKLGNQQAEEAFTLLRKVLELLDGKDIDIKFAGFYGMVAEMHYAQNNYLKAYQWREKFSQVLLEKLENNKKTSSLAYGKSHLIIGNNPIVVPIEESRKLAVKLAGNSELSSSFISKFEKQRLIIISLSALTILLLMTLIGLFLRLRSQRIQLAYEDVERTRHVMANPMQTKFDYQLSFKKARKYQYPLTVGYLMVVNWQELEFHFNSKNISEVSKDIASVINEQLTEFDYAGLLNKGEYLLLLEHQTVEEASAKLDKLVQAVNTRSFATLGDFSVTMKYSLNRPDFKDIDPYLFLARIAESVNIKQVNQSQVSLPQVNEAKVL